MERAIRKYLITATIDRKRKYFYVEALFMHDAIKIFSMNYPDTDFKTIKKLEELKS